jgi:hypothetical protein
MAFRGRKRQAATVELGGGPLDAVPLLTPAWSRPPWASRWGAAWERAVGGGRVRGAVVVPVRLLADRGIRLDSGSLLG